MFAAGASSLHFLFLCSQNFSNFNEDTDLESRLQTAYNALKTKSLNENTSKASLGLLDHGPVIDIL
jgi:hypothetical protein